MLVPPYLERSQGTIVTSANTILVNIQTAKLRWGGVAGVFPSVFSQSFPGIHPVGEVRPRTLTHPLTLQDRLIRLQCVYVLSSMRIARLFELVPSHCSDAKEAVTVKSKARRSKWLSEDVSSH